MAEQTSEAVFPETGAGEMVLSWVRPSAGLASSSA